MWEHAEGDVSLLRQDLDTRNTIHAVLAMDTGTKSMVISFRGTQLETSNLLKSLQAVWGKPFV